MRFSPRFFVNTIEKDITSIPTPVKIIVFALFVHSLAWGVLEPLESIYFSSFVSSYFETGIIFASFNFVLLLLAIPGGALSDKVDSTKLIVLGLLTYPFSGQLYASAGNIIQLYYARAINGVGATLTWVSAESFIRKKSQKGRSAETFGLYTTATNLALVTGAIAGSFLVLYFEISALFLLLIPLPLIAIASMSKIKKEKKTETIGQGIEEIVEKDKIVAVEMKNFLALGLPAIYCLGIAFFSGFFYQLLLVFVPLTANFIKISLNEILLLYALAHIPLLFGFFFAEIADRMGKMNIIFCGFLLAAIALPTVYFFPANALVFTVVCFLFGLSMAMIGPALNGLITDITPKTECGEITGIINFAFYFGAATGPLFFGALADGFGLLSGFLAGAIISALLAITTIVLKSFLKTKNSKLYIG